MLSATVSVPSATMHCLYFTIPHQALEIVFDMFCRVMLTSTATAVYWTKSAFGGTITIQMTIKDFFYVYGSVHR